MLRLWNWWFYKAIPTTTTTRAKRSFWRRPEKKKVTETTAALNNWGERAELLVRMILKTGKFSNPFGRRDTSNLSPSSSLFHPTVPENWHVHHCLVLIGSEMLEFTPKEKEPLSYKLFAYRLSLRNKQKLVDYRQTPFLNSVIHKTWICLGSNTEFWIKHRLWNPENLFYHFLAVWFQTFNNNVYISLLF